MAEVQSINSSVANASGTNGRRDAQADAGGQEFLVFTLGAEEYGIDILKVQEIRGYDNVTRIANAPEFIKGVINLRGIIVPIVDMLAQDFQDLTGQVIKKITDVVYLIEQQLLGVLVENIALERREQFAANAAALKAEVSSTGSPEHLLNGPQINPEGKTDVVQDQSQVDDLLASLGF